MTNRIVSIILVLSIVGLCFAAQGDKAQEKARQDPKEVVVLKMAVQIPTPKPDEVTLVLASGDFCIVKIGQIATIPEDEKFRTIVGENASFSFVEKGARSGNNFWRVDRR